MKPSALPLCLVDTREPHPHARTLVTPPGERLPRCAVCGGRRACEPVFRPWIFAEGIPRDTPFTERPRLTLPTRRQHIDTGDYGLPGLEGVVGIERKGGDLLETLLGEAPNNALGEAVRRLDVFRAELERARSFERFELVLEVSQGGLFTEARRRWERYAKSFDPFRVLELLASFATDYGVPTIWTGSRALAELYVGRTLARVWSQHTGGAAYGKAVERGYAAALPWARATPTPEARAVMDEVAALVGEEPPLCPACGVNGGCNAHRDVKPANVPQPRRIEVPPAGAYAAARGRRGRSHTPSAKARRARGAER